jgi:hypothetical protein
MAEPPAAWAAPDAARTRPAPPGAAPARAAAGSPPPGLAPVAGPAGISADRTGNGLGAATQNSATQDPATRRFEEVRPERSASVGLRPIPLRPLTTLETIDAAVGSVRAVEPRLLGWGMAAATGLTAAAVGLGWVFDALISRVVATHSTDTFNFFGDETVEFGARSLDTLVSLVAAQMLWLLAVSGMAVTVLGGIFAKPVRHYIDALPGNGGGSSGNGSGSGNGIGGNGGSALPETTAPGRLVRRLSVIALITALPRLLFAGVFAVLALASANRPNGGFGGLIFLAYLAAAAAIWLCTSQWAVAAPACALEGLTPSAALARSGRLIAHGRWRVAWTALLAVVALIAVTAPAGFAAEQIYVSHGLGSMDTGADTGQLADPAWFFPLCAVAALTLPLATPVRATLATMQYVDRRFRREGLDIRIAWARSARAAAPDARATAAGRAR